MFDNFYVNGTHKSEESPPDLPFFTGKSKTSLKRTEAQQPATETSGQPIDAAERKVGMVIHWLFSKAKL